MLIHINGNHNDFCFREELPPSPTNELTPWEKWRLRKVKEELEQKEKEEKQLQKQRQEEERKRKEKEESEQKAAEKYNEWLEKKCIQLKTVRKQEQRRSKTKAEIEAEKKAETERKAQEKFDEWMAEKKKKQAEQKKKEAEKKKKEEEEKKERQKRAEEKYEEWCKQAQRRPKSSPSSLGYAGGKLTGKLFLGFIHSSDRNMQNTHTLHYMTGYASTSNSVAKIGHYLVSQDYDSQHIIFHSVR
jgi:DNA repair exonuclease SbcCD ATPase subunit